jgi:outer membrane receptor for monomeric catechols
MADFERRRRVGIRKFLDRKEIEQVNSLYLSDVLRRVPGVRLMLNAKGRWVVRMARAVGLNNSTCQPQVYLDGISFPVVDEFGIDAIFATDMEAIEVFRGPSEVPPQYGGANSACGVILMWTKVSRGGE